MADQRATSFGGWHLDVAAAVHELAAHGAAHLQGLLVRHQGPWLAADIEALLGALGEIALDPHCTNVVLRRLRPIMPELVHRALSAAPFELARHEHIGRMLVSVLPSLPHLLPLAVHYYSRPPCVPPFERILHGELATNLPAVRSAVESTFWLVELNRMAFVPLWQWHVFYTLLGLGESEVEREIKWYAVRTLAAINGMGDAPMHTCLEK